MRFAIPWRLPAVIAIIAGIFAALLLLQFMAQTLTDGRTTASSTYTDLGVALESCRVLPLGSLNAMHVALSRIGAGELAQFQPPQGPLEVYDVLSGALRVYVSTGLVRWLEIEPAQWRRFPPGKLSQALRRIARADYYTQAQAARRAQGLRAAPANFSFTVIADAEKYEITPLFENDHCILLRITRPHPKP